MGKRLELTGQRFERLTVIEFSHVDERGKACWLCVCDCGKEIITLGSTLKDGHTKSCGCLQKQRLKEALEKRKLPEGVAARNEIIRQHKRNARIRNLEQALTDEQIIAIHKENCHYCDVPPSTICLTPSLNGSYTYNGIDRIDNTKGYTMDNSVSSCKNCNLAKQSLSYDEFLDLIKQIHSHLKL